MMQEKSILFGNAIRSNPTISTAEKDTIKMVTRSDSTVKRSGGQNLLINRALHVPEVEHSQVFV